MKIPANTWIDFTMTLSLFKVALATLGLSFAMAGWAASEEDTKPAFTQPTIERLKQTGEIRIGYGSSPPFSYRDANGNVMGYTIDLCKAIAAEIGKELSIPELRIVYLPRTPSNRIQLLNDGSIDIECAASTNTPERAKVAAFSPPLFATRSRFVSLAKNNINSLEDLRGKSISVVLGTVNIAQILQISREQKLGLVSVPVTEVNEAFKLVTDGRVSAFAMDDVLLSSLVAQSEAPEDYRISGESLSKVSYYGLMSRVSDAPFAQMVAKHLRQLSQTPAMQEIYDRWFMKPIGERGHILNMPMSEELKAALAGGPLE